MSRAARVQRLRRRPSRVVPATIVAVALLAVGVLGTWAGVQRLIDGRWSTRVTDPAGAVAGLTWGSATTIAVAVGVLVVGLVLVLAAVVPGGYRGAQLAGPAGGTVLSTDFVISTRSMARLATAVASGVDGVQRVSASASSSQVLVRVSTPSEQTAALRDRVQTAVVDRFAAAGLQPAPRVRVTVATKEI